MVEPIRTATALQLGPARGRRWPQASGALSDDGTGILDWEEESAGPVGRRTVSCAPITLTRQRPSPFSALRRGPWPAPAPPISRGATRQCASDTTTEGRRAALAAGSDLWPDLVGGAVFSNHRVRLRPRGSPGRHGQRFPPLDLPTLIEIGHRWVAALVTAAVTALAVVAWRRHRRGPPEARHDRPGSPAGAGPARPRHRQARPAPGRYVHLLSCWSWWSSPSRPSGSGDRPGQDWDNPLVQRHEDRLPGDPLRRPGGQPGLLCLGFPLCQGTYAPPLPQRRRSLGAPGACST